MDSGRTPSDGPASPAVGEGLPWFALYVKSRQERTVEGGLARLGLGTYLPMMEKVRKWSDRKKVVRVPYFPGYVFVRCTEEERGLAWKLPGSIRYLGAEGRATPVDPRELEAVREALLRRVPFEPYPHLAPGQPVTVTAGALKGLTGILVGKRRNFRLVLQIRAMGQGIAAEVDATDVEPI
ncbi:MAG: UpxY family transcription antiterminator [Planctomycetaceae bacterium]|nr:UpxY family transcription antiterminator [Planctomycetota bacterium]NUN53876.1 UpxY family transcription antiterminator [Planctomycetaceae bacterium]